ncbi:MAG TPA: asparagine synthase (glutamine-hydrolyzing) [Bacteroidia bacterium]|nr:asparagine synthase (glutamine-hydrolyzing) [Bacteroidia bacterium]
MCGIAGIFGSERTEYLRQKTEVMTRCIAHRGPDDEGIFAEGPVALGHRRLAIIDLSPAGHQPMHLSDTSLTIVYNGEIYNYKEIRKELTEYTFVSDSDTEVILAAYKKWGESFVNRLNGMFAFAIFDAEKQELFLSRDRLGIKPLYYYTIGDTFLFSSEIRSLLASGLVPRSINTGALTDYFSYQTVHAPETLVKDVLMLMPGHSMKVTLNGKTITKYWGLTENVSNESKGKSYAEVCEDVRTLLTASVNRRLVSDVPFGAFLSGGIDSSAVVGLMSQQMSRPVKTFNIAFDEGAFSEAVYARKIAERFATEHHEFRLTPGDFLNYLPDALMALDHPSGDGPNSWIVSKITRENGITMALSGLGGDELFAGYPVFSRTVRIERMKWLGLLSKAGRTFTGSILAKLKQGATGDKLQEFLNLENYSIEHTYPISRRTSRRNRIASLLNVPLAPDQTQQIVHNLMINGGARLPVLSKVSISEIATYMQNVLLRDTDQMSMASALEVRVPFIDYTLVEYVLGIKDEFKNPVFPKKLLVDSLQGLLPDEIVHRKKMGFTFPWEHWIKNELRSFCEDHIHALANRSFMNGAELKSRWSQFLRGEPGASRWPELWICVVLEHWLRTNQIEN